MYGYGTCRILPYMVEDDLRRMEQAARLIAQVQRDQPVQTRSVNDALSAAMAVVRELREEVRVLHAD